MRACRRGSPYKSRVWCCVYNRTPLKLNLLVVFALVCRSAAASLQTVLDKKASGRLCRCIEDAHTGMAQGPLDALPASCLFCMMLCKQAS